LIKEEAALYLTHLCLVHIYVFIATLAITAIFQKYIACKMESITRMIPKCFSFFSAVLSLADYKTLQMEHCQCI